MRQVDGWWSHSLGHKGHIAPGGAAHGMQDGLRSSIYHIQPTTRKIFILPVPKFSRFFPTVQNGWNQRRNLHRPTWPSIDRWARVSRYESPPPLDVIKYQQGYPIWGSIFWSQSHLICSAQPRDLTSEILRPPVQEASVLCTKLQGNLLVHPCALSKKTMISILTCIRAK